MKLSDAERYSINRRLKRHQEIYDVFKGSRYTSQHCRYCNWASNGLNLDRATAEDRAHIQAMHAVEDAEIQATEILLSELQRSLHDHDCQIADCACKCGCKQSAGCILLFGPLCGVCTIRENRGDNEHGEKGDALADGM